VNGPEHYKRAEDALNKYADAVEEIDNGFDDDTDHDDVLRAVTTAAQLLAIAQVHAVLALTAATVRNQTTDAVGPSAEWVDVYRDRS
jgi:hypothetical protein